MDLGQEELGALPSHKIHWVAFDQWNLYHKAFINMIGGGRCPYVYCCPDSSEEEQYCI